MLQTKNWLKKKYIVVAISAIFAILIMLILLKLFHKDYSQRVVKVGFVYIGDASTAYTNNFCRSQQELENAFPDNVITIAKYNIPEDNCTAAIQDLIDSGCDMIFGTSFGYGEFMKKCAALYPKIQFVQATCSDANKEPVLQNYHNCMGTIYQGRYISGVVAGMKLKELIEQGRLSADQAKIGYVAAFPYAEVISGYTAFLLGVRSVVPQAVMKVRYTDTWSNTAIERRVAEELINEGCVVISQHSDTMGPAIACEVASVRDGTLVFHVGYNQSMTDVAPTTSLIATRINWTPYIISAVEAVIKNKKIESYVKGSLFGNDAAAGFDYGWCEMVGLNRLIAAEGTEEKIETTVRQFKNKSLVVFKGDYIGINPFDSSDYYDLRKPFIENAAQSAPAFNYVLRDVITVEE